MEVRWKYERERDDRTGQDRTGVTNVPPAPMRMFSAMVMLNRPGSCSTTAECWRRLGMRVYRYM
jgi:hypothetical protein